LIVGQELAKVPVARAASSESDAETETGAADSRPAKDGHQTAGPAAEPGHVLGGASGYLIKRR